MGRAVSWIGKNADGFFVLVLAAVFGLVAWLDVVSAEATDGATLLVLALLAASILRDRSRQQSMENEVHELTSAFRTSSQALDGELAAVKERLDGARIALENLSMVRPLSGQEVNSTLREARRDTSRWSFKGGTGTFMRAVTLPDCVNNARTAHRSLRVRIEIVDPTNTDACNLYSRFRQSLDSPSDSEAWTLDRVRKESYATIMSAAWWRQRYDLLKVEIGLSPTITTLRWDVSDSSLIITQEDPRQPALVVTSDRFFYERFLIELDKSFEQARKVPLDLAAGVKLNLEPTVEDTQRFFTALGLDLPSSFTDRDVQDIIRKVIDPKNYYEDDQATHR